MTFEKNTRSKNGYMPLCLRLKGQRCLVIGGGRVASRKINVLRKFGASITCISPALTQQLEHLKVEGKIRHIRGRYSSKMSFKEYRLVIAATNGSCVNRRIAKHAKEEKVLVNIVDGSIQGDVIMPAILERKGLVVAISTNGVSPSKAKRIRDYLSNVI